MNYLFFGLCISILNGVFFRYHCVRGKAFIFVFFTGIFVWPLIVMVYSAFLINDLFKANKSQVTARRSATQVNPKKNHNA